MAPRLIPWDFRASFRFELFIIFTCLTLFVTILFNSLYIVNEIGKQRRMAAEKVHLLATRLAESIRLPLYAENREALLDLAQETARHAEIHAVVISTRDGRVLTGFHRPVEPEPSDLLSETVEVRSNPLGAGPETAISGGSDPAGALIGSVRLEHDTSGLKRMTRRLIVTAGAAAMAFWLIVSLLSYLALRKVTRSFNDLMSGLERMRGGEFSHRIEVRREDEPGRAAMAVNELAASLKRRDEENRRLQEELLHAMRLEVQAEKKLLMAKLIQTNRMTSLGLLASSMAHEINNPNGSIRLAGQYLGRAWNDALPLLKQAAAEEGDFSLGGIPFSMARDNITECCATIDRGTDRIAHVVQDLRSYSLGERNELRPGVDLNQVVAGSLAIVRAHGRHSSAAINSAYTDDLPCITGSHHQLEQVVVNLLMNALQSLENGKGTITVTTTFDPHAEEVLVVVRDEGAGIPSEHMERLRDPFFSTRIDQGGSGLGLFVADFIVSGHNGSLAFASNPGAGTTVTVRLPVHPPSRQA